MMRFMLVVSGLAIVTVLGVSRAGGTAAFSNWPAYLLTTGHTSTNYASTAITPANTASLVEAWTWTPAPPNRPGQPTNSLYGSPTVFDGRIYIGSNTGVFYALDEATGHVLWKRFIGFVPQLTCGTGRGITATATVALDPATSQPTVYIAGGNGYLYALDAANGAVKWRSVVALPSSTVNDYYNWSSPTVLNGKIYIGVSAQCDNPLVRAGVKAYDQATGALLAKYFTVPNGSVGGSVWSSVAASAGADGVFVWASVGNPDEVTPGAELGDSYSIVRLDGTTLNRQDKWTVPGLFGTDLDFGSSPTLFVAPVGGVSTKLIGACNKNGTFYAWKRFALSEGPVWSIEVAAAGAPTVSCITSAIWDSVERRLFVAASSTTINGTPFKGSIRRLNPQTGAPIWERGLPCPVLGSPAMNGAGVIAVGTYGLCNTDRFAVHLFNAANGNSLGSLTTGSRTFAQPVFADDLLLVATETAGLTAYRVGP